MKPFAVILAFFALFGGGLPAAERKPNVLFYALAGYRRPMISMVAFHIPFSGLSRLLKGPSLP